MTEYIDAHCHMNTDCLPVGGNVTHWICNSTTEFDWCDTLTAAAKDARVVPCIGVHPWYVANASDDWDVRLRQLLVENPNVMIGECGLDKLHPNSDAQLDAFTRQLNLAHHLNRTAHIHCVRAWDTTLRMLRVASVPRIVAHAFRGTPEIVHAASNITDAYFSYSDIILHSPTQRLTKCILSTPMDRILVESDSGPMSSAETLPKIIDAIAKIKSVDNNEMAEIVYNNAKRVIENG